MFKLDLLVKIEKPLVNKKYLIQKFPGKDGWTYALIPEILQEKHNGFGWVRVRGMIDHYEIKNYNLMPMGNGQLFLPLKAEIRKYLGKQEGDYVKIILYADDNPTEIPTELELCLKEVPLVYQIFLELTDGEKKAYIDWIYSAKTEKTKVSRINNTIKKIAQKVKK